jgi:hypothetical protein
VPIFKNRLSLKVKQGITVFLNVEVGLTRNGVPNPGAQAERARAGEADRNERAGKQAWNLEKANRQLENKDKRIASLREALKRQETESALKTSNVENTLDPGNLVWIFGTNRVGSTWLASMMDEPKVHAVWHEPLVGALFGDFYYNRAAQRQGPHAILGRPKGLRSKLIRTFVLQAAKAKFPRAEEREFLIVKEPSGSLGAPLISEALPESRMIFLVRDPRDVVSSNLSGHAEGGWFREAYNRRRRRNDGPFPEDPDTIVRSGATKYRERIGKSREAFESHKGPKVMVRYEELRADTFGTMMRIYSTLGIPVDEERVARAVEKHAWENIPEEKKGEGKFYRKATPGGWKEDLTPEQAMIVEEITAPLLKEFYPGTMRK